MMTKTKTYNFKGARTNKYRIRAYNDGAWYEVGIYEGVDEKDAIRNCKRQEEKNYPFIFSGLKLEAWKA